MQIINLTPHDVYIIKNGEVVRSYAPSGQVAKLTEWDATITINMGNFAKSEHDGYGNVTLDGIKVVHKVYGDVVIMDRGDFLSKVENPKTEPFPAEAENVAYIVPMLVGQQLAGKREDLYGPDFGIGGVRTADGKISGAVGFIKY